MASRTTKEWSSDNPDAMPPKSVYLRLFRKQEGKCGDCGRKLHPGNITREHVKPIWEGGENRESNIQLWCTDPCSLAKNGRENTPRAKTDRQLAAHLGLKTESQQKKPFPGSKGDKWQKKYNKHTQRWETVERTP